MLTPEQIDQNRALFITLTNEISVEGADIAGLINYLDNSDFFIAPASTIYHGAYEGGLCQHCLDVYAEIERIAEMHKNQYQISENSLRIVALFHDISKINFYEKYVANKKKYDPRGSKKDTQGNFDWFTEEAYKIKDTENRLIGGSHGFNSMMILNQFIPTSYEESVAIYNHHFTAGENLSKDLSAIYNRYPLATMLYLADMAACYLDERV